jgi:LIVCS family branched-chain amino acid:cation transporter
MHKTLITGLALFSMFFGSGNMIFPLFVGTQTHDFPNLATLAFNLSASLLPVLGFVAMVVFNGDYARFFGKLSRPVGFLWIALLLIFWIPFGSGPRCITLSYAAVKFFVGSDLPLWLYSLIYSTFIYVLTVKRTRILDILGIFLTPALLVTLGLILLMGLVKMPIEPAALTDPIVLPPPPPAGAWEAFFFALREGYYTMDMVAAFFFASTVIGLLQDEQGSDSSTSTVSRGVLLQSLKSGFVAIFILGIVYWGLIKVSAKHSAFLLSSAVPKEELLPHLAYHLLGRGLGSLAAMAMGLACITTSVALVSVFSDFLRHYCLPKSVTHPAALFLTSFVIFCVSLIGFEGISRLSSPAFEVFYPLLLIAILLFVPWELRQQWKERSRA